MTESADQSQTVAEADGQPRAATTAELIGNCQGLVRSLALQIRATLPGPADLDDLIGYGQVGLAEAARVFNPDVNVKFSTFAYYRIRGAIFDGISKMAWFRTPSGASSRYERGANEVLADATESHLDALTDARWLAGVSRTLAVAHLASALPSGADDVADDDCEDPATATADREVLERLAGLIDRLPEAAASLIRGVYFEGLTLQEAGERLGVSKSWASRLHARVLDRLGRELRRLGAE